MKIRDKSFPERKIKKVLKDEVQMVKITIGPGHQQFNIHGECLNKKEFSHAIDPWFLL